MKSAFWLSRQVGVWLLLVAATGCRPENQNMLVAYVEGDVFLPNLRRGDWRPGEAKLCQIASKENSVKPDQRGDLLLCGYTTQMAWSQTWLRGDIKTQIYEAAQKQAVNFHSTGNAPGTGWSLRGSPSWLCRSVPRGIDCD